MEPKNSSVDEFFKGLPENKDNQKQDIFNEKTPEQGVKVEDKKEEEDIDSPKNRRERRLQEKWQKERESNIALNERLRVLAEVKEEKESKKVDSEVDPRLIEIFGKEEAGLKLAKHFTEVLLDTKAEAREEAIREIESQQEKVLEEQKGYEDQIDQELEAIEDTYNVDLTSNTPQARKSRKEFLEMVQQLSPKDSDGTITGYADFGSTFEMYQRLSTPEKPDNTRRNDIASKSMQRSGNGSNGTERPITPGFDGWRKDYNLQ